MTPVPVVSTQLNTRTDHVCGQRLCRLPYCKTLVADPVFVVLPEAPDLACDFCAGEGTWITHGDDIDHGDEHVELTCESCGGSGVSPVYAATWQCDECRQGDGWVNDLALGVLAPCPRHERRQLVEWRARRVEPLPVVDGTEQQLHHQPFVIVFPDGGVALYDGTNDGHWVTNEPWAVDLRPGQFVLRLDGWEHLEQPYTEMVADCADCADWGCPNPSARSHMQDGSRRIVVPLSVPDGVLSWIELAA